MAIEIIEYRGYELVIDPEADGLTLVLKASGAKFVRPRSAVPGNPSRQQLIDEAKASVDSLLDGPHIKKPIEDR
jgi:hypothetical protein